MKQVCTQNHIILGGHDISHSVTRWTIEGVVSDLYRVQLVIIDDGTIEIEPGRGPKPRIASGDVIKVKGTDISRWVEGYSHIVHMDEMDSHLLHLHADKDVLTINGTTPWEMHTYCTERP